MLKLPKIMHANRTCFECWQASHTLICYPCLINVGLYRVTALHDLESKSCLTSYVYTGLALDVHHNACHCDIYSKSFAVTMQVQPMEATVDPSIISWSLSPEPARHHIQFDYNTLSCNSLNCNSSTTRAFPKQHPPLYVPP